MAETIPQVPVSVIIPCYRCAATIVRAVESIIVQTMRPMEVILVDDASGDETLSILRDIESTHPSLIKVVELAVNQGPANARNEGWRAATQSFIAFLDADDSWHPRKLEIQYEYMIRHPHIMLCGHLCLFLDAGAELPELPNSPGEFLVTCKEALLRNPFATPSVMLRREVPWRFEKAKRYAEDRLLWMRIICSGGGVVRLESPLAYVHKEFYGDAGLSANTCAMELAELDGFARLVHSGQLSVFEYLVATLFSLMKFLKRLGVLGSRQLTHWLKVTGK